MRYIDDLEEFKNIVQDNEEVLLYPGGCEGYITLDYLQYLETAEKPWLSYEVDHNICCVVSNRDMKIMKHNPFNHGLPTLHWSYLPHFRETAVLIVAANSAEHESINKIFSDFGFKNILFISSELLEEIKSELKRFLISGQALNWFINYATKKITETQHMINEQAELRDVNMKAFGEYKNAFSDKKVVIVGNGPTLKYYKPIPDAIHIGLNLAWLREDIQLDYLFITDNVKNEEIDIKTTQGLSKIKSKMFVSTHQHGVSLTDLANHSENISLMENTVRFYINGFGIEEPIFPDIRYHALAFMQTIAFPAIHFALFTYPKEIYLVGCDTTARGHFYTDSKNIDPNSYSRLNTNRVKTGYARMKMFADQFYPDTKIISINPVGLKGLFEDIYTDDYKKSLED